MTQARTIIGIDLGTTNSAAARLIDGAPAILCVDGARLLPSVVGFGPDDGLLVGFAARNQYAVYPERTVRSVKRRMGEEVVLELDGHELTPVDASALILRRLLDAAQQALKTTVDGAVITVPAYFSDAQRTATRQAGELAGMTVERIINEPTAAALCYADPNDSTERLLMVYDLGGGTFDVSIVRTRGHVTEVLSSHGDALLGGDDMDDRLMAELRRRFEETHGVSLEGNRRALARLWRATEEAKITLSTQSYVQVCEEHLCDKDGVGLHLNEEITRREYEQLIEDLVDRTMDSVQTALTEAKVGVAELDDVILVGGATRTPLVQDALFDFTAKMPRIDVNPDEAVAMGAAIQAARIAGEEPGRVLVDVTPFSFGTSFFGELHGRESPHCYKAIIRRNSPLPTRQTEVFYTMYPGQTSVRVEVFQGEAEDARDNVLIGNFRVENLDPRADAGSPILFEMRLGLDGILAVEVTERHTNLRKGLTIDDAFHKLSAEEMDTARERLHALYGDVGTDWEFEPMGSAEHIEMPKAPADIDDEGRRLWSHARALVEKSHRMAPELSDADAEELLEIAGDLRQAMQDANLGTVGELVTELGDILFYLE